ncbi:MAG: PAS domain S-box protein [Bacteroidales bacterium]|nr:PAS domain S-box protein [Bacteroidales bacterium]
MSIKKLSWRVKLITLFTGILGLSLIIQIFYVIPYIRNQEIEKTQLLHENIASNIAQLFDSDILQALSRTKELAKRDIFSRMDIPAMQKTIDIIVEGSYRIESIFAFNSHGLFICGTMDDSSFCTKENYADRPFFAVPFKNGNTFFSSPYYYIGNNLLATSLGVPIESESGERIGVLIAEIKLNHLIEIVKYYPLYKTQVIYVVDNNGKVIAHSGIDLFAFKDGPLSLSLDCPLIQNILSDKKDGSIKHKHEKENYYGSIALLKSNGWEVIVETPMKSILAESNIVSGKILFINLLIFVVAFIFTIIFARQITATQRKAEKTILESEEKHRQLIETTSEGFWLLDSEKKTIDVNQSLCDMLGYSRNEMIGKTPLDFVDKPNHDIFEEQILKSKTTKHRTYEISLKKKNGINFPTLFNATSLIDKKGKPSGSFAFITDISKRKQTEKALREKENYARAIFEQSPISIQVFDKYGLTIDANKAYGELWQIPSDEVIGKYNVLEDKYVQETGWMDFIGKAFEGETNFLSELEYDPAKSGNPGRKRTLKCIIFPIKDEKNEVNRVILMHEDITSKKIIEQEIHKHREHLEELVKERTDELDEKTHKLEKSQQSLALLLKDVNESRDELNKTNKEIEKKTKNLKKSQQSLTYLLEDVNEARVELENSNRKLSIINKELEAFSYSVSHDLRAPLTRMDGFSQALLETYSDKLDEQGKHFLNRIRSSSRHMAKLIDDMLALSRISRKEIYRQQIHFSQIAKEVSDDLIKAYPKRKVDLKIEQGLSAYVDQKFIVILLENLFGNALKFTGKKKNAVIEFGKKTIDDKKVFFIKDNGAGFNMKYYNKIFVAFQRLHHEEDFPGTGIGLAIVQRIINKHNGKIWAESEEGKGSVFYFWL